MKVIILGGYGAFGALLSELLIKDGHQLWIAGRNQAAANALATRLGCRALEVDRKGDLSPLFASEPDVIVDAAGPFQSYDDPYLLPKRCIAEGCSYLDLSDSTEFTQGITTLDTEARAAGVCILSGASSVPGLSSAVVASLTRGMSEIALIESAILPGNRAPRGRSVIASIVS
ncbi:saccharopine dehydrogenase NADP-binding domain-containing protein [Halovulum sp. GXIMD14793]